MSQPIGGQAVLEGVMMRGSSNWAVAVRKPDGQIAEVCRPIESVMKRHWLFRLPVIRGIIALGESLGIGFRALSISAQYAAQEEGADAEVETELSRGALFFAFAVAIAFAVLLFKVTPALITNWLPVDTTGWFVIVEGGIRVTLFIAYLTAISLLPDLRRVFQYHAAEHKAINAYEAGEELEPELSPALHDALAAGKPVPVNPRSIADGLGAPFAGDHGLEISRELVESVVLITEEEIEEGMRFLYTRAKLACEPAGAASTAALLAGKVSLEQGETVVAVVSGGNVAPETAVAILAGR